MIAKGLWAVMALFAIAVAGYALGIAFSDVFRTGFVQDMLQATPWSAMGHWIGGGIALAVGAFQFSRWLRTRHRAIHRWMGRIYVTMVLIGGCAALVLAWHSYGGLVTHYGFGLLAVAWLFTTVMAFLRIRRGDVARHQVWMIRSYALTLAAVSLRIYLPLSQIYGIPFEQAYPVISWLCWVPNILIAEWFVISRLAPSARSQGTLATG